MEMRPLVLVIHDWTGNQEFVQEKTRYFAQEGLIAFAVDLYGKGKRGSDNDRSLNEKLIGPLLQDRRIIAPRLQSALDCVRANANIDAKKIMLLGFCLGGMCALDFARTGADVAGIISIHGLLSPPEYVGDEKITAKILALHGYEDPNVHPDDIQAFAAEMNMRKADWQIHIFGNTFHSFTNPNANEPERGLIYSKLSDSRTWPLVKLFTDELFTLRR